MLEGYRSVLPHGVYPVAFLFLEIPLDEIDVNVHPAKTEIRFRRGEAVKDAIAEAIRTTLARAGITGDARPEPEYVEPELSPVAPPMTQYEQGGIEFKDEVNPAKILDFGENAQELQEVQPNTVKAHEVVGLSEKRHDQPEPVPFQFEITEHDQAKSAIAGYAELPPVNSAEKIAKPIEVEQVSASKIQPLGQMHDSFIIAVDDEGLLLIDQHVAHERILFDKYRKSETDRPIESQNLLLPETIDLSPAQAEAYQLIENDLEALGFGVMKLSGRTIAIKSIPTDLAASEARNLFAEILDTIEMEKKGSPKSTLRDDIAASLACKAAVKINMKLTPEKMHW